MGEDAAYREKLLSGLSRQFDEMKDRAETAERERDEALAALAAGRGGDQDRGERITAKAVPYSGVVGSSVTLHAESGFTIAALSLVGVTAPGFVTTREAHKAASVALADWIVGRLNGARFSPRPAGGEEAP